MNRFVLLIFGTCFIFSAQSSAQPQKFFWGVANAAFQVEGEPVDSDWLRWTREHGRVADSSNADRATGFWRRYKEDFDWAQKLGANSFRISIAWERIQPRRDVWDEDALRSYEEMLIAMRERGLEPIVTLCHFVLPAWVHEDGGLFSKTFANDFANYAEKVVTRLHRGPASVRYWMTFNEPGIQALSGYIAGEWPPGKKGDVPGVLRAFDVFAKAHILAAKKLQAERDAGLQLGVAQHWRLYQPISARAVDKFLARNADKYMNRFFIDAIAKGRSPIGKKYALPQGRSSIDFIGINYYGRTILGGSMKSPFVAFKKGSGQQTDIAWEIHPEGLDRVLTDASSYHLPLLISENGLADSKDQWRADFIRNHADVAMRAKARGLNVIGYLHWSLTDNFEWALGLTPRFGLIEVDYETLERRPRPSFYIYRDVIKKYQALGL